MGTYVTVTCCVVVALSCLLPSASSAHKKKIIVKVPHIIKHIHHDHFKPIHLFKVRSKDVEHHYSDNHEDTLSGWKHGQKNSKKRIQKLRGSFSQLKPISLHEKVEGHVEYQKDSGEVVEFDHNQRVGHRLEFENASGQQFSQEEMVWQPEERPAKQMPQFREDGFNRGGSFKRENIRLKPIDFSSWKNEDDITSNSGYSGETWDIPKETYSNGYSTRNQQRVPNNKQFPNNEHKNKRAKHFNWSSKEVSSEIENEGWKPMVDFNAWKSFNDMDSQFHINHNKHFIDSGEYMTDSNEDLNHSMQKEVTENNRKKNRKQNRKNNHKYSKQIVDLDQDGNHELPQHAYQIESPKSPILPQLQPQFYQTHQIQPYSIPLPQAQHSWPEPSWPTPQPAGAVWQPQTLTEHLPQPQPPTITPKTVWSGHHLQMPQHSMWHVQQHSDGAPPLQVLSVNENPLQQPLQYHQPHSLPQQLSKESSSSVHHVMSPGWPLARNPQDSSVKQHWEQHVQTTGSDGPASSYRVEVINYTGKKST